jgi:PAS domain S-box-containing protein
MIKILAIDDNKDNLISIKALINEAFPSATLFTATNGEIGLEIADAEDPDVILLDVVMPGMYGFEVCKKLKADKKMCDIPVVFVTAIKGEKESRIRALESGGEAFLAKPIDETELTAQIRAMVKIKHANVEKRDEKKRLAALVFERTRQLENELETRKKTEMALKASEERFQLLFNQAPLGYQSLDIDGNFIEVNQKWLDTLGYSREEVTGKWFGDFLSPAYQDGFRKRFPIFKAQGFIHSEFEMVHKDGRKLFIAFEGKIGYDIQGEFKQTHCILQDVTQRKESDEKLRKSEQMLNTVLNNFPGIVFWKDTNSVFLGCNQSFATGAGLRSPADIIGKTDLDLPWKLTEAEKYRADDSEVINSGVPKMHIIELQHRDNNRLIWLDTSKIPILGPDGQVIGVIGVSSDITERKQAEIQLRESEEKYRNMFADNPQPMLIYDLENLAFLEVNQSAINHYGYSKEEFLCMTIADIRPSEDLSLFWEEIERTRRGESQTGEWRHIKKNGEVIIVEIKAHSMVFNGRSARHVLINDITERKKVQEELIVAKEKAEESDRLKSAFLANMSHEIRTPLNCILGFTELLADPDVEPDQRSTYSQLIEVSGNNLLSIINDIMDISKIEAGHVDVMKKTFSANRLIVAVQNEFAPTAIAKGIELRLDPTNPHREIFIKSDENKIKQVLANFVSNALKFTEKGSIEIGIQRTGEGVQFQVKDTGIGIAKEFHNTIFERFRQVESFATRQYGGNGLGLAISKKLVSLLGGKIGMESDLGKGSMFYFIVPL